MNIMCLKVLKIFMLEQLVLYSWVELYIFGGHFLDIVVFARYVYIVRYAITNPKAIRF